MILYLAHPVAPFGAQLQDALRDIKSPNRPPRSREDDFRMARALAVERNLANTKAWFRWIHDAKPEWVLMVPWYVYVQVFGDDDGPRRVDGLRAMQQAAARCDGVLLTGGVVSEGMGLERDAAMRAGKAVVSLVDLGYTPPTAAELDRRDLGPAGWLLATRLREALGG